MSRKIIICIIAAFILISALPFLFVGAFVAYANSATKKQVIVVTLKDTANIESAKTEVSNIPHVKRINVKTKEEEWSKMVNKMDLPKMENPFKDTIVITTDNQKNLEEVYKAAGSKDFTESVTYENDIEPLEKIFKYIFGTK